MENSLTTKAFSHIKKITTQKFYIGKKEANPLTQDLHHAVTSLSAELYGKDVHFIMELIRNAEDNEYKQGAEPTLEFVLTKKEVTGTGAPATLLVFNNGFLITRLDFPKRTLILSAAWAVLPRRGRGNKALLEKKVDLKVFHK